MESRLYRQGNVSFTFRSRRRGALVRSSGTMTSFPPMGYGQWATPAPSSSPFTRCNLPHATCSRSRMPSCADVTDFRMHLVLCLWSSCEVCELQANNMLYKVSYTTHSPAGRPQRFDGRSVPLVGRCMVHVVVRSGSVGSKHPGSPGGL
jgi:hypothetical protein